MLSCIHSRHSITIYFQAFLINREHYYYLSRRFLIRQKFFVISTIISTIALTENLYYGSYLILQDCAKTCNLRSILWNSDKRSIISVGTILGKIVEKTLIKAPYMKRTMMMRSKLSQTAYYKIELINIKMCKNVWSSRIIVVWNKHESWYILSSICIEWRCKPVI